MTGGQYSGTTPRDAITKTSPYGHIETGFDVCRVVQAAGGSFVARGTVYDVVQLNKLIEQAIAHKGFSFVGLSELVATEDFTVDHAGVQHKNV